MKAISINQPWASLIAEGKKTVETNTYETEYRGDILIVSSKCPMKGYSLGQALCIANLINCRPLTKEDEEAAMVKFLRGMFAWIFSDIRTIKPFPVKGKNGIYEVDFNY